MVSEDLSATGFIATLNLDVGAIGVVEEINEQTKAVIAEFRSLFPEYELVTTGGIPMMTAFGESSDKDLGLLLPVALVLISILLFVFFGGIRPMFSLVGLSLIAAVCTLGIAGWLGLVVNAATSIVPLVVFTIVTASSMHLVLHFLRISENHATEEQIAGDVRAALDGNIRPMLASAFTSAIGLLSLSFVESPPLQQLGQLSALGTVIGLVFAISVLPLLLSSSRSGYSSWVRTRIQRVLNTYARQIEEGRSYALIGTVLLTLLLAGFTRLEIDDDFIAYFDYDTEFRVETERAIELLAGPNHIEVLLENSADSGIFDLEYVNYLMSLVGYLRAQPEVANASSYADVLIDLSTAFGKPLKDISTAEELAQWYLVYELSLQRGQSNTDLVRSDQKQSRVSVLLSRTTSNEIKLLERRIYEWHDSNGAPFHILVTGENIPVAHISALNITSMIAGLAASIALITFVVSIFVRETRLGVVALAGSLAPLLYGFGAWGLLGFNVGLASTAIIAVTIGVVIDDAVHMVYRFVDAKNRLELDGRYAAAYSVHRAGMAVTTTSLVLVAGLSTLLLSSFEINSSFGAVTCLIISLALLFDILVLPRLLVWSEKSLLASEH